MNCPEEEDTFARRLFMDDDASPVKAALRGRYREHKNPAEPKKEG